MKIRNLLNAGILRIFIGVLMLMGSVGVSGNLFSQQCCDDAGCFEVIQEISGIEVDNSELKDSSCSLVQEFSPDFYNDFKVYDFGFYSLTEYFNGFNYPEVFSKVIDEKITTPYYLLFGKLADHEGLLRKFFISLKLPETGLFSCLSENDRFSIEQELQIMVNDYNDKSGKNYEEYVFAEKKIISHLKQRVKQIQNCCLNGGSGNQCVFNLTDKQRTLMLLREGFYPLPVDSIYEDVPVTGRDKEIEDRGGNFVNSYGGADIVSVAGYNENIEDNLNSFFSSIEGFNHTVNIEITNNENLNNGDGFELAKSSFKSSGADINLWIHLDEKLKVLYINHEANVDIGWIPDTIPPPGLQNITFKYQMLGEHTIDVSKLNTKAPPPVLPKSFWGNLWGNLKSYCGNTWYIKRALEYASENNISADNIFYYSISTGEKIANFPSGTLEDETIDLIIVQEEDVQLANSEPHTDYKHIFRHHKSGVGIAGSHDNDSHWLDWDNAWTWNDEETRYLPIPTKEDMSETIPVTSGFQFNGAGALNFAIDVALMGEGSGAKFVAKKSGEAIIEKEILVYAGVQGGKKFYKVYAFEVMEKLSKQWYFGRTARDVAVRFNEHKRLKEVVSEEAEIIVEIDKSIPNAYKTMKGIEQVAIEFGRKEYGVISNKINAVRKYLNKSSKVTEKYKECVNFAEEYLKSPNNKVGGDYRKKFLKTIQELKKEFDF